MRFAPLFALFLLPALLTAQVDTTFTIDTLGIAPDTLPPHQPWRSGGAIAINFNQVALSNWNGGGENTFAVGGMLGLHADYDSAKVHWSNELEAGYGFTKAGDLSFRKSDDMLTVVSKVDYDATNTLLYSALLDFRSQFSSGFDYDDLNPIGEPNKISDFLSPGYLNVGLGATWQPSESFEIFVAPISNRLIILLDEDLSNIGAFGVGPGEHYESELGSTSRVRFQRYLMENIEFGSRLNLFAPFEDYSSIVINWENLLSMTVNEYISVSISFDLIYDENVDIRRDDGSVGPGTQMKEALAVGIGYTIGG